MRKAQRILFYIKRMRLRGIAIIHQNRQAACLGHGYVFCPVYHEVRPGVRDRFAENIKISSGSVPKLSCESRGNKGALIFCGK